MQSSVINNEENNGDNAARTYITGHGDVTLKPRKLHFTSLRVRTRLEFKVSQAIFTVRGPRQWRRKFNLKFVTSAR